MMDIGAIPPATGPAPASQDEKRLRGVAQQLEGVFVQQLFKAMRETVPHEGKIDGGAGEERFTSMLDEKISDEVPAKWEHGIGEALMRQLRHALPAEEQAPGTTASPKGTE
jgi:flagellar protein FlgJ